MKIYGNRNGLFEWHHCANGLEMAFRFALWAHSMRRPPYRERDQ